MHNEHLLIRTARQRSSEYLATADRMRLVHMSRLDERQARRRPFDLTRLHAAVQAWIGQRAV